PRARCRVGDRPLRRHVEAEHQGLAVEARVVDGAAIDQGAQEQQRQRRSELPQDALGPALALTGTAAEPAPDGLDAVPDAHEPSTYPDQQMDQSPPDSL